MQHLTKGETNKQIARALGISPYTVREYVQHAARKLGCRNRVEVATWWATHGDTSSLHPSGAPSAPDGSVSDCRELAASKADNLRNPTAEEVSSVDGGLATDLPIDIALCRFRNTEQSS